MQRYNDEKRIDGSLSSAELGAGPVFTAQDVSENRFFFSQSYLSNARGVDLNILPSFVDYSGRGVSVAVIDQSVDVSHSDLSGNYDASRDYDFLREDDDATLRGEDSHGTAVAGVIAAANDDDGIVGVAHGATIAGLRIIGEGQASSGRAVDVVASALSRGSDFDVTNNSYSFGAFTDSFHFFGAPFEEALEASVREGRGGLGTVNVFAAGNAGDDGADLSNFDLQSSRHTIAVGAMDASGVIAPFSTPGAGVLVSAQGVGVLTTDAAGQAGYVAGDFVIVNGTSFAAPMVSGVVALMLEANPDLGYRDVQKILAITARQTEPNGFQESSFQENGAVTVNGGGLSFSHSYGFGVVDATAAVRLAETWTRQSTAADEQVVSVSLSDPIVVENTGVGEVVAAQEFVVDEELSIQHIEIDATIAHARIDELSVRLVSPTGTASQVFATNVDAATGGVRLRFDSVAHLFENTAGAWRLEAVDANGASNSGLLRDVDIRFFGDPSAENDTHFFTDDLARTAQIGALRTLQDLGADDAINAAAVSSGSTIDLGAGDLTIAGVDVAIAEGARFRTVDGGDGDDLITGDSGANTLSGGRGDDTIDGGGGDDTLIGAAGDDVLRGGAGFDTAIFRGLRADFLIEFAEDGFVNVRHANTGDLSAGFHDGVDQLFEVELLRFDDVSLMTTGLIVAVDPLLSRGDNSANRLFGGDHSDIIHAAGGHDFVKGRGGADRLVGAAGRDNLVGDAGDDFLDGGQGRDRLVGGEGNDVIAGGGARDRLLGRDGDDRLIGGGAADVLRGGDGADVFVFDRGFGRDRIVDFDVRVDALDFSAVAERDALTIEAFGNGVLVSLNARHNVFLRGVDSADTDLIAFL